MKITAGVCCVLLAIGHAPLPILLVLTVQLLLFLVAVFITLGCVSYLETFHIKESDCHENDYETSVHGKVVQHAVAWRVRYDLGIEAHRRVMAAGHVRLWLRDVIMTGHGAYGHLSQSGCAVDRFTRHTTR